jgi:hypothetical protein
MSDVRLNGPIPAPSEAQLDAGADRDPNARVAAPEDVQPPLTDDQINTSVDGNAPHTQPTGEFSGSEYPVDPANPNDIEPADQRLGNVANVDDLDEQGRAGRREDGEGHRAGDHRTHPGRCRWREPGRARGGEGGRREGLGPQVLTHGTKNGPPLRRGAVRVGRVAYCLRRVRSVAQPLDVLASVGVGSTGWGARSPRLHRGHDETPRPRVATGAFAAAGGGPQRRVSDALERLAERTYGARCRRPCPSRRRSARSPRRASRPAGEAHRSRTRAARRRDVRRAARAPTSPRHAAPAAVTIRARSAHTAGESCPSTPSNTCG